MITEYCRNFTPEQMNLWRQCNGLIAWNTIVPLCYSGLTGGSEFEIYNANKLYIAFSCLFSSYILISSITGQVIEFDLIDNIKIYHTNNYPVWDTTAAIIKYALNDIIIKNVWFSRILASAYQYNYINFNGFRLTLV